MKMLASVRAFAHSALLRGGRGHTMTDADALAAGVLIRL